MALLLQPTLGAMVSEVLAGLNLGVQGELTADLHPLIQRNLRDAQAFLWNSYRWLQNRVQLSITLVDGETDYEIPDSFNPGSLRNVYCQSNRTTNSLVVWDLQEGIDSSDRNSVPLAPSGEGLPYAYQLTETILRVFPEPTGDDLPTMILEMDTGCAALIDESERPAVDGRAMVMLATITTKESRRIPVGQMERALMQGYIDSLRSKQRESIVFTIGTDYRHPMDPTPYRRTPYDRDNWRPSPSV